MPAWFSAMSRDLGLGQPLGDAIEDGWRAGIRIPGEDLGHHRGFHGIAPQAPAHSEYATQEDTVLTGLAPQPQRVLPPGQLEHPPAGAAEFFICDCTIDGLQEVV
jgi:hypothetical protein